MRRHISLIHFTHSNTFNNRQAATLFSRARREAAANVSTQSANYKSNYNPIQLDMSRFKISPNGYNMKTAALGVHPARSTTGNYPVESRIIAD